MNKAMYAVIETGGKQFVVKQGDYIRVERLPEEPGKKVVLDRVLFLGGDKAVVGTPLVAGAKVEAKVIVQERDSKIVVFKKKRRKGYRKTQGHRQDYTEIKIEKIVSI